MVLTLVEGCGTPLEEAGQKEVWGRGSHLIPGAQYQASLGPFLKLQQRGHGLSNRVVIDELLLLLLRSCSSEGSISLELACQVVEGW